MVFKPRSFSASAARVARSLDMPILLSVGAAAREKTRSDLLLADAEQLRVRAKDQPITANRGGRCDSFAQTVLGKQAELWTSLNHEGRAVVVADVDATIAGNW